MQALDFDRARISWTTKAGIDGSWRVIASACQESGDCIYLAPAVMAGEIFGTGRLPRHPPYSYQLVATRRRHAIIRESEPPALEDSDAENEATFSSFDIQAPRYPAKLMEIGSLYSAALAETWPISGRLKMRGRSGELWNLEFPVSHISTRASQFQIESGPVLIPSNTVDIAEASIIGGCYLAYLFLNKPSEVELLAWGPTKNLRRSFVRFARIDNIETEILSRQPM
ncbi:hypothetical protein ABH975_002735 [Bradyrhizobium ottawaense]